MNENDIDHQTVEEFETIQNYVNTLFDSLPKVDISSGHERLKDVIGKLMQQNRQYGKKIIELSEKFTSFYRKDHIIDRKQVQQKIRQIYCIIVQEQDLKQVQIDVMLSLVLNKIKQQSYRFIKAGYQHLQQSQMRNLQNQNILANNKMIESKMQLKNLCVSSIKDSISIPNENIFLNNLRPNGQNTQSITVSRKQSILNKTSKNVGKSRNKKEKKMGLEQEVPLKSILRIKGYLQEQEGSIKSIFQKINARVNQLKVSKLNIQQQKLRYTRVEDECNSQNLQSLLQASTTNHRVNLNNICQVLELVFRDFDKKVNQEMQSQGRFNTYTKQIQKRQEVYSYAVSKLIGQINSLRSPLAQQRYTDCMEVVENLLSIGTKFYQLYPSNSIIRDLKLKTQKKQYETLEQKNYAVQVNTFKQDRSMNKNSSDAGRIPAQHYLQLFRLQIKLTDLFEKFEKNQMKFKKAVQVKQISRLIISIKDLFPDRNKTALNSSNQNTQAVRFQEQFKKITSECQIKQQKLLEQSTRKQKKYQKTIKQLQQTIQVIRREREKQTHLGRQEVRKLAKKIQNVQQKCRNIENKNSQGQKVVRGVRTEIQDIKKKYRQQELKYMHKYEYMERKIEFMNREIEQKQSQITLLSQNQNEKATQSENQIMLYKKKIVLLQDRNSALVYENQSFLKKLELFTISAQDSKQKLCQMTQIYEKQIRQIQDMIQAIKQLKRQVQGRDYKITELQLQNQKINKMDQKLQQQLLKQKQLKSSLRQQLQSQRQQKDRIKEVGQLNEFDIQKLKEQMRKVHAAYMQSQEQLQSLRTIYQQLQDGYNQLQEQNAKLKASLDDLRKNENKLTSLDKVNRDLTQRLQLLQSQAHQLVVKGKQAEDQLYLAKKQGRKLKEQEVQQSRELRQLRQQVQRRKQEESLLKGKHKIELETTKIQLRKKTQQNSRIKQLYEQKLQMVSGKYKQLQKYVTQKQLLAKISNNHSTQ